MRKGEEVKILAFLLLSVSVLYASPCQHIIAKEKRAVPITYFIQGDSLVFICDTVDSFWHTEKVKGDSLIAYYRCAKCGKLFPVGSKKVQPSLLERANARVDSILKGELK